MVYKWIYETPIPIFIPKYRIGNLTPFRKDVYDIMNSIPFGETLTYLW